MTTFVTETDLDKPAKVVENDAKSGVHYKLVMKNKDWKSAADYCQSHFRHGSLVAISTKAEQLAVAAYLKTVIGQ